MTKSIDNWFDGMSLQGWVREDYWLKAKAELLTLLEQAVPGYISDVSDEFREGYKAAIDDYLANLKELFK